MVIFDCGFENNQYTYIAVEEGTLKCRGTKVSHAVFRNYPMLQIHNLRLEECIFENCHTVYFADCKVNNCHFDNIQTIYVDRSPVSGCEFTNLRCDNDCVICLEDSEVSYCTFKDIELTNEAHLTSGVGDVWVESCSFENICTDRKDRELFFCEETVGKIFKKKVQFSIVDEASCNGLDEVRCTADTGKQLLWMAAYEKGLVTERAMEVMREGVSFDETRVDAKTMALPLEALIIKIPVYNCLTRAGLKTVGDLVRQDIMQILQIKHLGKVVITEVVQLLHSLEITGTSWDNLL
ncbi:MAG: hypothetical protein IJV82_02240 [Oscillospiraceae bacterium]|nr:hypothetical protein [Oscillospiraceae bacterium]